MASTSPQSDAMTEHCGACGRDTPHSVSVELRTESDKRENVEFSREPYRVSRCQLCGIETTQRMNNA